MEMEPLSGTPYVPLGDACVRWPCQSGTGCHAPRPDHLLTVFCAIYCWCVYPGMLVVGLHRLTEKEGV